MTEKRQGYVMLVHPDVEHDLRTAFGWNTDAVLHGIQNGIRHKVRSMGHTPELQAQCAVIGHARDIEYDRCYFCLARLDK